MDEAVELAWLRERVKGLESALLGSRRELFDLRCRLAVIARVAGDLDRAQRAPGVAFGAINAALHGQPATLGHVARHVARRRPGPPARPG
ncbi:hypothetical protein ACVCAH_33125 [Micromonospora sp. LZ34]